MSVRTAVVILNYNGKKFLEKFLPGIIRHSSPHEIIVADNASGDDSVSFIKANFPSVRVIQNAGNFGYAKGYNLALEKINADYFILLNNDVEVAPDWIEPVIELMEMDKKIAACQPKLLDHADKNTFEYAGAGGGFIDKYGYPFCRGRIFNSLEKDAGQYNGVSEVFWASGACLFVRSEAFRRVGGFDEDYFAHMEEIDLCWRMKNLGYKIYVQPSSVVYHVGGGTLSKISARKTYLNFRNNLTTLIKNHPPRGLFIKFLVRLVLDGVAGAKFLFGGDPAHCLAVIKAHWAFYFSFGKTLKKRKEMKSKPGFKYSVSQIYNKNIVLEYFLRGLTKFSLLNRKNFIS